MEALQPYITQIAVLLRGLIAQISPQAAATVKSLPDIALVGAAAGGVILALIILFTIFGMIGALFKPKKKRARDLDEERPRAVARAEPQQDRAPDPVRKIQRDAETGVARVKQDTERLTETLLRERDRVVESGLKFASEPPTRAFALLSETLTASDAPALGAARRKIMSGDFAGARADLRRHAQDNGGRDGAWRNVAALECLHDLAATVAALEQSRAADPRDFVTLVLLRRLYSGTNQPQQARDAATAAVAAARDDRERAIGLDELGVACMLMKDGDGARKALSDSLALVERLAASAPKDFERQRDVAVGQYKLATLEGPDSRDRLVASIAAFERLKALRKLDAGDEQALAQLKSILNDMGKAAKK